MSEPVDLLMLLGGAASGARVILRESDVEDLWRITGVDLDAARAAFSVALAPAGGFDLRIGDWELDLPRAAAQAAVSGSVVAGVMAATGGDGIVGAVLGVVLPFLVDLERVEFSPSDRRVYGVLLDIGPNVRSVREWYAALPADVRAEITSLEFRDLLGRLQGLDLATPLDDDAMLIPEPGERRRIALRLPTPAG